MNKIHSVIIDFQSSNNLAIVYNTNEYSSEYLKNRVIVFQGTESECIEFIDRYTSDNPYIQK